MENQPHRPATHVEGFHTALADQMKYRPIGGSLDWSVSILSLGASSLGGCFHEADLAESIAVVHMALQSGINLIDTAPWYGHGKSEEVLGKALVGIPRQAYYLTTKCGRYNPDVLDMFDFRAERIFASVDESLARLGLEYIDVLQVHDPEFAPSLDIILHETLPAMHKLKMLGKVKHIGVTGYPLHVQKYLIEHSPVPIDTSLVYCHYSLNDTTLVDYLPFYREKKVAVIGASPISMGLLSHRGPPSWHPASAPIKAACAAAAVYCAEQNVDISKLALHFSLGNAGVPTTLVSTASLARVKENIAAVHETLSPAEQAVLEHIVATFFAPLKGNETWEGLEVAAYFQNVGRAFLNKALYSNKHQ